MDHIPGLIEDPAFLRRLRVSQEQLSPPPILRSVKIKLTSRCNLRCTMCDYWKTKTETIVSSDQWKRVFAQLAQLRCRKIHFSGGEVFLRRDFLDLAESAVNRGLRVNFTTNGTLLDKEKIKRIAAIKVNGVSLSLDGPNAETHDRIRGIEGAFAKTTKSIRLLRRASSKIKLRVNFVVMRDNFRKLPRMVRLAGELGATDLIPMPVDEKGERKRRLSRGQIAQYNRDIAPEIVALRKQFGFSISPELIYPFGLTEQEIRYSADGLYARGSFERKSCLAPWLHLFIAWDGETYLCCMTNGRMDSLGNVKDHQVQDIFHGPLMNRVRERFLAGYHEPACQRCDLFTRENAQLHQALASL